MPPHIRPNVLRMRPYPPGKPIEEVQRELGLSDIVKLASNENPLGPSPLALSAIQEASRSIHLYPDARSWTLKQALAQTFDVDPDWVLLGAGSDEIIGLLGSMFLEPGTNLVMGDPSFMRYDAAAFLNAADLVKVRLTPEWKHDLEAMGAAIPDSTRLVFIANPNNPTGTTVTAPELDAFLDRVPESVLVVLDEAYFEFAKNDPSYPDSLEMLKNGRNVVVLRTFSKAYGLAGLRVGFGFAPPDIVTAFNGARAPFDVNSIAQAAATAALKDTAHLEKVLANNHEQMRFTVDAMHEMGLETVPSHANFVCVDVKQPSRPVFDALMKRGVIVRPGEQLGMPTHIRVSIGTKDEMVRFVSALKQVLQELPLSASPVPEPAKL